MKSELEELIEAYEIERAELEKQISEYVSEGDYLYAYRHQKCLGKLNNMLGILKMVFFLFVSFFCSSTEGYAQVKLKSCGLDLTIPSFKQDSAFSDAKQILVRKKFLIPIHSSKSDIEIRLYYYPYFEPGKTVIINCDGNKFKILHYNIGYQPITDTEPRYKKSKNLGPLPENPGMNVLVFYENKLKLKDYTWKEFFQRLIDNHFFDLIPETEIKKKVKLAHPDIIERGEAALYVQIKVGNLFRNVKFSGGYDAIALDIPEYQNLSNIYKILNQIQ
ncbi:hypothetical protein ABIE26_005364 [Pedobacter africanus]|uniref:Uncharacterized protein n=1 Tax=Pedobacter africanus TaxID=151894 RepID=A0ACC6L513_9SPHI|nr:hypothetical protein [Pedobacter africanus]MDR6786449.1 hypothetical protein [Pedobacter africanus]